ncbi:MAG TPA: dihydrofolate reductase, partial [Acholeplasma sp.]|nr:dihydrofolate reductase [Acholeplasma sp.]
MISLIVAMTRSGLIGKDNDLPWNYPEDLQYFKKTTLNKTVAMGEKTFLSIYNRNQKPLPKR